MRAPSWLPSPVLDVSTFRCSTALVLGHCNVALVLGPFCSPFGVVEIVPVLDTACSASPLLATHGRGHQQNDKDDRDRDHDYDDARFDGGDHHDSAEHVESFLG